MPILLPLLILSNLSKSLILRSFSATLLVLFPATTRTLYSHIINIIYIYSIIDISMFLGQGKVYIINIYYIIFTINIYLLWTNRGQCPHPFTANSILHIL